MTRRGTTSAARRRGNTAKQTLSADIHGAAVFIRDNIQRSDAGLCAIGSYLFNTFFDGDPDVYAAKGGNYAALRGLFKRAGSAEVPVSKTGLSNALGLAILTHRLGPESALSQLPQSHATELLPLLEPEIIERAANDILASPETTVREVRAFVRDAKPKRGVGRRPKPPVVRALQAFARVLGEPSNNPCALTSDDFAALTREEHASTLDMLANVREHLGALQDILEQGAAASSDVGTDAVGNLGTT